MTTEVKNKAKRFEDFKFWVITQQWIETHSWEEGETGLGEQHFYLTPQGNHVTVHVKKDGTIWS